MFGLASALTAGPAAHWTTGELMAQSHATTSYACICRQGALLVHAACICWLSSHSVDTAQESHSLPGLPAAEMNFVIFPFAFFAGGIIPLVRTCF